LTDDWPELTTYFDAEIIGSRYGFLTQNWGATQHEDMVHWSRFPAFKHIRHEAKRPHMTIDGQDRGAVFMRWKERFVVPDHRVQDINGASFAGKTLNPISWHSMIIQLSLYKVSTMFVWISTHKPQYLPQRHRCHSQFLAKKAYNLLNP
jgi:hypothetical protein